MDNIEGLAASNQSIMKRIKDILLCCLVASAPFFASCDGDDKEDAVILTVTTTASAGTDYNGLTMQLGTETDFTTPIANGTINADGKVDIAIDITPYIGKTLWFCMPGVAKFFHTLTAEEAAASAIVLPDKENGCTLDATGIGNDWQVAIYMGVNKEGKASETPIYWATGNIIGTKTNTANSGLTQATYHLASKEESVEEGTAESTRYLSLEEGLISNAPDCFEAMPIGSQWDLYSFGDATGLMRYMDMENEQYIYVTKQKDGDNIVYNTTGDARYDVCTAQLGKTWRIPTCRLTGDNEWAAFMDHSFPDILPDSEQWTNDKSENLGRKYSYEVNINGRHVTTNTLYLPAGGYVHAALEGGGRGKMCWYWGSIADPTGTPPFSPRGPYPGVLDETTTAFNFGFFQGNTNAFPHPRWSCMSVRPVCD